MELIDLLIGMAILTAPVLLLAVAAKVVLDLRANAQRLQPSKAAVGDNSAS